MPQTSSGDAIRLWPLVANLASTLREVRIIAPSRADPALEVADAGRHTVPTLLICLEGVARLELGRGHCDIPAGTAAVIAPWLVHAHPATRPGCSALHLGICPRWCDASLQPAETETGRSLGLRLPRSSVSLILPRLLAINDPVERLGLARELCSTWRCIIPTPLDESVPVRRMKAFLLSRLGHPHPANAILAASGLGRRRAHAVFSSYFGITPKAYLDRLRLTWAQRLITDGVAVAAAARIAGFGHQTMLSRRCRDLLGHSPRQWKRTRRSDPS